MNGSDHVGFAPSFQITSRLIDRWTGVRATSLGAGRRRLDVELGALGTATVLESPATALTEEEWRRIADARQSYQYMWGGGQKQSVAEINGGLFDGRGAFARFYRT